jgi:pyrroloquinoline quinone biosynthesis protein B
MLCVRVLGAAAGGGFPQWNANSEACRKARAGDPAARTATQASIAVTADERRWFVVNASPDLRQQIEANRCLQPSEGLRSSPIRGLVLTNGDVDAIAGLLHLREGTPLALYAHAAVLKVLDENPVFEVLDRTVVARRPLVTEKWQALCLPDGEESGLEVNPFVVPGKIPLYREGGAGEAEMFSADGYTLGLEVRSDGGRFAYVANCASITDDVAERLRGIPLAFIDGTLFSDDEMIRQGVGKKTGRRMGHISMTGPEGTIERLKPLGIGRKIFIHINNTNPALLAGSPERRHVEAEGFEIAYDGMEVRL